MHPAGPLPPAAQILALEGAADSNRAPDVASQVSRALALGARSFVIDLSRADSLDSVMLRTLLVAHRQVDSRRGRLVFVCAHGAPRRLFELTGLDTVVDVVASCDDALARAATT
jgi:anti-anti-sigma factor